MPQDRAKRLHGEGTRGRRQKKVRPPGKKSRKREFKGQSEQENRHRMKTMRMTARHWLLMLATMALAMTACDRNEDFHFSNAVTAVVTVRPQADGAFTMQLDNATVLAPVNLTKSPFGDKEVRALTYYSPVEDPRSNAIRVNVHWIDSIRTKLPVPYLEAQNDRLYGNDPIDIVRDWVSVAEDGYLTLRIRTLWGNRNIKHQVNLLTGMNANDAYEVELRHNAMGDTRGQEGDALIAFNLNHLPHNGKDDVKLKLHWNSFSGPKTMEMDLHLHTATTAQPSDRAMLNSRVE